jgi:hypothetical protein
VAAVADNTARWSSASCRTDSDGGITGNPSANMDAGGGDERTEMDPPRRDKLGAAATAIAALPTTLVVTEVRGLRATTDLRGPPGSIAELDPVVGVVSDGLIWSDTEVSNADTDANRANADKDCASASAAWVSSTALVLWGALDTVSAETPG